MSDIPKFGVYKGMMTSYEESIAEQLNDGEDILEWDIKEIEDE
tara:strand:+ start:71 stop:199 length:129 start_codon:yes stop_codon:yes gene_type:complete